jgi:hypothetical protein
MSSSARPSKIYPNWNFWFENLATLFFAPDVSTKIEPNFINKRLSGNFSAEMEIRKMGTW